MGLLNEIAHIVLPLAYGAATVLILRLLWQLLRKVKVLNGLHLTSRLAALFLGIVVVFAQLAPTVWPRFQNALLVVAILLLAVIVSHVGERLFLLPYERRGRQAPVPRLMRDIVKALLLIFVLLVTISELYAIELSTLVLSSTVLTAVIGLALQDLLKNVFSGIALQLEQPFKPGDWVVADMQEGQVVEMSWRAVRLSTRDGYLLTIPNGVISQQRIQNFGNNNRPTARHLELPIDSAHPPTLVCQQIMHAALCTEGVLRQPEPRVRVRRIAPATVVYDLKYWLMEISRVPDIESDVMASIWYHLRRANMRQASNEVLVVDEERLAARAAKQDPAQIKRTLRSIDLFAMLSEEELETLVANSRQLLFGREEELMEEGAIEDTLFVIQSGVVRIELRNTESGQPLLLKRLRAGKIIGEFALLTGEPRSATVVADQDTVVIVIGRADLAPILERNPALPELLGHILARRSAERAELTMASANGEKPDQMPSGRSLAQRIRNIFALLEE